MMSNNHNCHAASKSIPGAVARGTLLAVVFVALLLSLTACGSKASEKAINLGKQAVEAVDRYMDGSANYRTTQDRIDELYDQFDYLDSMDKSDEVYLADFMIKINLLRVSTDLLMDDIHGDIESYNELKSSRNDLAGNVGARKR